MTDPIAISSDDLDQPEDRFSRFRLIGWWDQKRLASAKALVVGAGALGNEIVKNLALLGWGNVLIADLDRIENSNLSRSILYRARDNGRPKAEVASEAAREIWPGMNVAPFQGNVVYDLGLGAFRWADVVFGGLDNREARLAINRACWKFGTPWVDGAIEQIQGVTRTFVPPGPCYECTMSDVDWELLNRRRSCNLLTRGEMETGKTPTTPTISSIIAGVQCQEGVKLLHGMESMAGEGWTFEGVSGDSYRIQYQRKHDCLSHEPFDDVVELGASSSAITIGDLYAEARRLLGSPHVTLELARDVLENFICRSCGEEESVYASLGGVTYDRSLCPKCEGVRRDFRTFYKLDGERIADQTPREIGVPPFDVITARIGDRTIGLEFTADARETLGTLVGGEEEIAWS